MSKEKSVTAPSNEEGTVAAGAMLIAMVLFFESWELALFGVVTLLLSICSAKVRNRTIWWLAFISLAAMCVASLVCLLRFDYWTCFVSLVGYLILSALHLRPDIRLLHKVYL